MKVQTGAARMLINTSSKIAQIARSRPIPFDIPCKRYGREPFFDPRRNTHGDMVSICELHARTRVTYTNAKSECIIVQKKENDGKGKLERRGRDEQEQRRKRERRGGQTRQKASPISQTCPICVVCKINHALPCHTVLPRSPGASQFSNPPVAAR